MGTPSSAKQTEIGDFLSLVRTRRSIRAGFDKDAVVPDEYVSMILEAARWAPSAGNSQPWEFVVVRDPQTREKIASLYKSQLKEKIEIERVSTGGKITWSEGAIPGLDFHNAPVHVVVLGDPRVTKSFPARTYLDKWESHFYGSLANSVIQMLLAAEALGLSSLYISDAASPWFATMLKSLLDIPEPLRVYNVIPIGYAKKSPTINHPRRPLDEMIHSEKYERSKFRDDKAINEFVNRMSIRGSEYKW
jgi:nitroreductase